MGSATTPRRLVETVHKTMSLATLDDLSIGTSVEVHDVVPNMERSLPPQSIKSRPRIASAVFVPLCLYSPCQTGLA